MNNLKWYKFLLKEETEENKQIILDSIVDKIIVARVGLLMRHPFFGNMATRLKITDGTDWCPTAATDGRSIFYNREFFEKMTPRQVEFVVAHEIHRRLFKWQYSNKVVLEDCQQDV